jgi:hypothetical protein
MGTGVAAAPEFWREPEFIWISSKPNANAFVA